MMAEKTIEELKKLFLVISKQYQEYKKVVAQLKHVLNERGNTIMKNKLEIFSLRKDGYSGPPEDEKFFKICHTIQMRLLESHTEAYYKDFNSFEKNIEKKFRMMDTELERLQRIGNLWDEKQHPVENMSKIIKKKEVEIMALKQEMCQLFKQKQQDRIQITTLQQESKPTTEKILLLKQTYEKERSIRRQILEQLRQAKGDWRDLDAKLKTALEENNSLQEKYQKESSLHKTTKDTMKRLQRQFRQMVQEKNCLQSKYEKDTIKCKLMKEASDKTIEELQIQLKEKVKEHKCLEKNYEKEKCSHKNTKEAMNQVVEDLQSQLQETLQEYKSLKKYYEKQIFTVTEELEQNKKELINNSENQVAKCEELQVQMQSIMKDNKTLEENYQQENDQHKVRCNAIEELEVNLQQGEEKIISIEETYLKQVDTHGITKDMLSQTAENFQDKINQEREGNQNFEEKYENEKSLHEETQEQLVQANQQNKEKSAKIKELEFQLQQAVVENMWTNENYRKELSAHKHTKKQLDRLNLIYEKEKSKQKNNKELEQCIEITKKLRVKVIQVDEGNNSVENNQKVKTDKKNPTDKSEKQATEINKCLEVNCKHERSAHRYTRKELEQVKNQNRVMNEKILQLEDQLQQAAEENEYIQEKYVTEMSMLQPQLQFTLEELDQAKCESKILKENIEEIEQDNEQLQISEIVEQEYKLENKDLMKRLYGCKNLLKVKLDTISRLEQQLLTLVQQCAEREKKYVKILNCHIVKEHQLKKELEKVSKPIPQRISSWWHEKVLKSITFDTSQDDEEELNLYPEDWRLPEFPDYDKLLDI